MIENKTLLVLDVDILIRHPLAEYLRECGYRVVEACTIDEAKKLVENVPDLGLVLADAGSDPDDAFEFAQWVRTRDQSVRIVLAGTVNHVAKKAANLCEESPQVSKPYDHRLLLERIKRSLARRRLPQESANPR